MLIYVVSSVIGRFTYLPCVLKYKDTESIFQKGEWTKTKIAFKAYL